MAGGRPMKYKTLEELQEAVDKYFKEDAMIKMGEHNMFAPTMSGLAYSLGMCRKTLLNYSNKDEFLHTIKDARNRIAAALEQRLYFSNPTGVIFNLKNNFDWKDKQEVETKDVTQEISDDDLNAKIVELMEKLKNA